MSLAHFSILNNEIINKDTDVVKENLPLLIFDGKSAVCISNNGKGTKHTRHISRIMHFLINGEEWNMYREVWCEGGLELSCILTKDVRGG